MASPFCLCLLLAAAAATSPGRLVPYDLLYADGVRAYFARDWGRAAELLQRALHSYAGLRAARRACRAACRREAAFLEGTAGAGPWEAALFGRVLQRADCLQHCLGRRLGAAPSAHRASQAIRRDFERREPYNYLQVAFFQVGTGPGGGGGLPGVGSPQGAGSRHPRAGPEGLCQQRQGLALAGLSRRPPAGGGGGGRGLAGRGHGLWGQRGARVPCG